MQPKLQDLYGGQSSVNPTGERKVWDLVWKANVPPKLRIFAWRVASDSLGTRQNLNRRIATVNPTCSICGCEVEDAHHALITCTVARALREELRMQWLLPNELAFRENQKEWIFALLGQKINSELKRTIDSDNAHVEEKLAASDNFSGTKSTATSLKMMLAKETSKEVESKSNPPSVIARLMGLVEDFPAKEPVLHHARDNQSCNHTEQIEKAPLQEGQHHSMQPMTQFIDPSCQTIEYNGVYEGCEEKVRMSLFQGQSTQKRRYPENNSCRMDVVSEKIRQAKYLVTKEKVLCSGGLQEYLDVLSSEKDLCPIFHEEPILARRMSGLHTTPAPPQTRITVLKPTRAIESDVARQSTTERAIEQNGLEMRRFHQRSSSKEGTPSQPSRIVLLRPTPGKPSITKAKLTPKATPFRLIDGNNFRAVLDAHGATRGYTGVAHDGHDQRDESLLSSTYSNGYGVDESSFSESEIDHSGDSGIDDIEEDGGSISDLEAAKQQLSEQWAMVTCDDISGEQVRFPRTTCTLGEMLSLNEVKKEDVTTCIKDNKTVLRSRKLPRSISLPKQHQDPQQLKVVACSLSWDDDTLESPLPGLPRHLPSDVDDDESECHVLVQNIMSSPRLDNDARSSMVFTGWHLPDCPLDPVLCNKLLELRKQRSYQRLLVDCVNVALVEIGENALLSSFSWSKAHTRTWRGNSSPALGVEVWSILKDWIYGARMFVVSRRDNTGIMTDRVVKQEVEGSGWVKMMLSQVVDITEQIEAGVLEALVAETVLDFAACCCQR
ncbi:hypothetical protein ACQ4PT_044077 [Festuca glaucescens]